MARESRETGARPRRRNHLLAAAAILTVIVAVGLMLEFMPGSGPTVTATPKPESGRAHPVAGGKTANPHAAMTGSPHAAKAANPHAAKQDDVKDAKAADTKDAKAAEATRSAAADAKAADTKDGKATDSKAVESKDGKSDAKSVVSVTPFGRAFTQGIEAMRSGDAHAAAQAFDQARAINPHIPEAHINLGFAFLAMKRPNEAAKAFDEALAIDPKQVNAYYGLGAALDGVGDREGAMGAMRSYIHLADENDKFRRKAMAAVWEWEAEQKAAAEKKAAETKAGGENETADAKAGEASKTADAKSGAEAAQATASASKDAAGGTTPDAAAVAKAETSEPSAAGAKADTGPDGHGAVASAVAKQAGGALAPPSETAALPDAPKSDAPKSATAEPAKADAKPTTLAALQSPAPRDPPAPAPLPDITQVPGGLAPPEGMIHIVNVWASWCGPCRAELPSLQKMAAALDPKRYRVIGLNIDKDRDFAREFIRDTGVSFDNFWDGKGVYARERYKTESYPQTLFLNSSGAVLARIVGAREWPVEAADAAVAEMLAAGGQPKEAK